jgi:hypothetical protein
VGVDVSTVIRIRQLAKDAALAAFAASQPGRMPSVEQAELDAALAENDRLSDLRRPGGRPIRSRRRSAGWPTGPIRQARMGETAQRSAQEIASAVSEGGRK